MKPRKPFMVYSEALEPDSFAVFNKTGKFVRWNDWDGTKFQTKQEATQAIKDNHLEGAGAKAIEILDELRARV